MPNIITERAEEDADTVTNRMLNAEDIANGMTEQEVKERDDHEYEGFMTKLEKKASKRPLSLHSWARVAFTRRNHHPKRGWPLRFHD